MDTGAKKLVATGFLSKEGLNSYRKLSGLDWELPRVERTRELLLKRNITSADYERLRAALQADVSDTKRQFPKIGCLAIATPGLEVLSKEEVKATGLEIQSQIDILVKHCSKRGFKHIGLFGTEWDVSEDSPLIQALERNHIDVYAPRPEYRASVSACATTALKAFPQLQGRILDACDFCAEVVDGMIHEACGTMEALVICNPEFRALMPLFRSKRKQFFAITPIIDLTSLYWDEIARKMEQMEEVSQPQEKPSG